MPNLYPYQLRPYAGRSTRSTCPSCGKAHSFTHYINTQTGEILPEEYGRCDRETNCGYHLSPYTSSIGSLSYAAIEKQQRPSVYPAFNRPSLAAPAPTATLVIPDSVCRATLGCYQQNALARLLREHFGLGVANELLARFHLGTSTYWLGACVFWLVDEQGQARGGQVVLYDESGHTVKIPHRHTTWAHTALARTYKQRGQTQPAWLLDYSQHGRKSPCLFGLSQLASAPAEQPVALVESAKTAMIATPYFPRFIWLATMGLSYLTLDRLQPLRGRRIVLFPDVGAFDKWNVRAVELRRHGFDVQVSGELERLATDEERKAGLDIADVLLREWPGYPPSWDDTTLPDESMPVALPEAVTHA